MLTTFDPGTRTLHAGFRLRPFQSLPVEIVFEKDVAVQLRDGLTIYFEIFRPVGVIGRTNSHSKGASVLLRLSNLNESGDAAFDAEQGFAIDLTADLRRDNGVTSAGFKISPHALQWADFCK